MRYDYHLDSHCGFIIQTKNVFNFLLPLAPGSIIQSATTCRRDEKKKPLARDSAPQVRERHDV